MESAAVQKVIYQPLNPRNQEIRLVTIKAGRGIDPVQCSLTQVSLDHKPQYEALSYVWGDPNNWSHIILQGGVFIVTSNLGTALSYLRLPEVDRTMWIDAICIDQNNFAERESQVQIMRLIYQEAEKVVSWLGAFKHERTVMKTAALLKEARDHDFSTAWLRDALTTDDRCTKRIYHFVSFCHKAFDYWSRIWITQEVALARNGIVKWKNIEIPYRWFEELFNTFRKLIRDVEWMVKNAGLANLFLLRDSCNTLAQNDMLRRTTLGTSLLDLLRQNRHKEATDPRDKVYALLGLSDMAPNSHEGLTVSYAENWSKKDIYTGVVRAVVHKTLSLNILCDARPYADTPSRHSSPNNQESRLPSWAPDWTVTPVNTFPSRLENGKGASGLTPAYVDLYYDKNIMRAQGICVGIVKACGRCLPNPPIVTKPQNNTLVEEVCHEWLEYWIHVSGDSADSVEAFCRTILLGSKAPPTFQKRLAGYSNPSSSKSVGVSGWFPMIHRSIGSFRFFTMNSINGPLLSNGDVSLLPGIGPGELQENDKICVLFGCKCPVALRPDGNRYRFVSPVFINSLHNGEAVEGLETGRYISDWFEIH